MNEENLMVKTTTKLVMMQDLNPYGNLFGGTLMGWMDQIALMVAVRYTRQHCVTVKFSEINFKAPVRLKDIVELTARITRVGTTSLTIEIEVSKCCFRCTEPTFVASATAVFVALDDNGNPEPIIRPGQDVLIGKKLEDL